MDKILENAHQYLLEAMQETFESIVFANVDEAHEEAPVVESLVLPFWGKMDITLATNKESYRIEIVFSEDFLYDLLQRSFPEQEIFTEENKHDFVGEICNTFTGNFMLRLEPEVGAFHLSLPISHPSQTLSPTPLLRVNVIIDDKYPFAAALFKNK